MKKGILKAAVLAMIFCGMGSGVGLAYTDNETNVIVIPTWTSAQSAIESVGGTMKDTGNVYGDWNTVVGFYNHIGDATYDSDYNEIFGFKNNFMPHDFSGYSQIFGSRNNVASSSSTVIGDNNNVAYEKGSPKTDKTYRYNVVVGNSNTANGGSYDVAIGYNTTVSADNATAIGNNSQATAKSSSAFGSYAQATGEYSTAIGYYAYTDSTQGRTLVATKTYMTVVSFGKNNGKGNTYFARLKNVYEGEDDYDAVNVKQLKNYVANNAGKYDGSDTVTVTAPTTTGAASTIAVKNMAMGADVTDAGVTTGATATGSAAIALGQTANAGGDKSLALGYGASVTVGNAVALGAGSVADTENTVSVGSSSLQRKIVNVADGEDDHDAATYGQLKAVAQKATYTAGDHVTIANNKVSVTTDGKVASGDTGIVTGGAVYTAVQNSYVDGNSYTINANNREVTVQNKDGSTAFKLKVEASAGGVYNSGEHIDIDNDYKISVITDGEVVSGDKGIVTGGAVYEKTGDTEKLKDAGLSDNLTDSILDVNEKVDDVTNQVVDVVNNSLGTIRNDINKVGAGAAALAALHPEGFDPNDKMSFAIGYGHYKNANAGAFGAFYKPNQDTTVSAGSTFGNGNPMVNMGVSFKIGTRTKGAGIYSSNAELVREMNSLKASDTDQAARIAALERENAEMKAQNAEMKAQLAQVMKVLKLSGTVQKRAVSD